MGWWNFTYVMQQLALISFFSVVILACIVLIGAAALFVISFFLD